MQAAAVTAVHAALLAGYTGAAVHAHGCSGTYGNGSVMHTAVVMCACHVVYTGAVLHAGLATQALRRSTLMHTGAVELAGTA
eukprot:7128550-Pyramimonas_sp.AAC.1